MQPITKNVLWVVGIVVLLGIMIGGSLAYFSSIRSQRGDIQFAEVSGITMGDIHPLTSENSLIIPGDQIQNPISWQNISPIDHSITRQADVFVRVRLDATLDTVDTNAIQLIFQKPQQWIWGDQGYYYYTGYVAPAETIAIISGLSVSTKLTRMYSGKDVNLTIHIECLQAPYQAYQSVWADAPQYWIDNYASTYEVTT